jgi:hypothetical protein
MPVLRSAEFSLMTPDSTNRPGRQSEMVRCLEIT